MDRPRAFVTRQIFPEAVELIERAAQVEVWPSERPPNREELAGKIASCDGVLTNIMDGSTLRCWRAQPG